MKQALLAFMLFVCIAGCGAGDCGQSGCGRPKQTTSSSPHSPVPQPPKRGNAPEFGGTNLNGGGTVLLSELRGNVVLVSFWASYCGPCRTDVGDEKSLFAAMNGKPFQMIGVGMDVQKSDAAGFATSNGLRWPCLWNGELNRRIATDYKVQAIPTYVLIDKDGDLAGRWVGGGQIQAIRAAIDRAMPK